MIQGARAARCEWLHVDSEDHLRTFDVPSEAALRFSVRRHRENLVGQRQRFRAVWRHDRPGLDVKARSLIATGSPTPVAPVDASDSGGQCAPSATDRETAITSVASTPDPLPGTKNVAFPMRNRHIAPSPPTMALPAKL